MESILQTSNLKQVEKKDLLLMIGSSALSICGKETKPESNEFGNYFECFSFHFPPILLFVPLRRCGGVYQTEYAKTQQAATIIFHLFYCVKQRLFTSISTRSSSSTFCSLFIGVNPGVFRRLM